MLLLLLPFLLLSSCRVKLRSGVKYIIKINSPTKASGGVHSIYTIPPGKPWEHSSGYPTMGTSPSQPETREVGRIRHRCWVPYKPQFNSLSKSVRQKSVQGKDSLLVPRYCVATSLWYGFRKNKEIVLVPLRNRYHHNNVYKKRGSLGLEVTDFIAVISSGLMSECK